MCIRDSFVIKPNQTGWLSEISILVLLRVVRWREVVLLKAELEKFRLEDLPIIMKEFLVCGQ